MDPTVTELLETGHDVDDPLAIALHAELANRHPSGHNRPRCNSARSTGRRNKLCQELPPGAFDRRESYNDLTNYSYTTRDYVARR
jgi:hypothetical protein